MLIQILSINPDGTIVIKKISGQFPEQPPEVDKQYTIYFESVENKVPEFNQ